MNVDIMHLAKLCKIKVDEKLAEKIKTDIIKILESVKDLPKPNENDSFFNPDNIMTMRTDEIKDKKFIRDDILKNAPQTKAGCAVVPKEIY